MDKKKYKVVYTTQGLFSGTRELEKEIDREDLEESSIEKLGLKSAIFGYLMNYHRTTANDIHSIEEI